MGRVSKIQPGDQFGRLTVLEMTDERKKGYIVWKCRCGCGREIRASSRELSFEGVTDCGCAEKKTARHGSVAEDLTGQRFGMLTVERRTENRGGRTAWLCRCDCGTEKIITAHDLKAGKCKSCGCLRKKPGRHILDLSGQRFGRLTALCATERRDKKHSVYWRCRCDCGKTIEVTESNLVHGTYRSCGCLKRELGESLADNLHMVDGTCMEFLETKKKRTDNTSGFRGICRMGNHKYRADIGFKGKRFYIGTFEKLEDAVQARKLAEEKIHGAFTKAYYQWKERGGGDSEWEAEHPLVFEVRKIDGDFVIESSMPCG
ncbi:MAG: transcriptional regulator [Clostridiales bacterium]|nr:transcriptional regulator [Clostridiales bacterium]